VEWWKRGIDIAASIVGLTLCAPVILIVSVLIKLTSPGPVLYTQQRIGLNRRMADRRNGGRPSPTDRRCQDRRGCVGFGKPFTMYKFRTMRLAAETGAPRWAEPKDPRVTRLGRILRKSRIDEIPQFVNVLRGDMSLVGPRPERAYFLAQADEHIPEFKLRLRTKPGITGLAQVEHGYTNSVKGLNTKLTFDLQYMDNLSLRTDLKILARTVAVVVTGRGAY
ncbi:MAG: sugar transferase, partial [Candidatus Krumholzibacteria bacterium]|nr:sugar transferase [Candidatus Krumholzibacteria bacterium]